MVPLAFHCETAESDTHHHSAGLHKKQTDNNSRFLRHTGYMDPQQSDVHHQSADIHNTDRHPCHPPDKSGIQWWDQSPAERYHLTMSRNSSTSARLHR